MERPTTALRAPCTKGSYLVWLGGYLSFTGGEPGTLTPIPNCAATVPRRLDVHTAKQIDVQKNRRTYSKKNPCGKGTHILPHFKLTLYLVAIESRTMILDWQGPLVPVPNRMGCVYRAYTGRILSDETVRQHGCFTLQPTDNKHIHPPVGQAQLSNDRQTRNPAHTLHTLAVWRFSDVVDMGALKP